MKSLNILQLFSDENWTGPADPVLSLSKELSKKGHRVYFACAYLRGRLKGRVKAAGIPLIDALRLDRHFNLIDDMHDISTLPKILAAYKIDIIHTNLSHDHAIGALGKCWQKKYPYLVRTIHRALPRLSPWERFLYTKMSDKIITVCESARKEIIQKFNIPAEKITTICGAVDVKKFNPENKGAGIREKLGLEKDIPLVGMIAPLQPHRKHQLFFEAISEIIKIIPETKFLLIGHGGSYLSILEKLARKLKIEKSIIYTGYWDEGFPELLGAIDVKVFLVPGSDGSCRAVLEAMATGKPIVSAPVGPILDIMGEEFPGIIINPENKNSFAEGVLTFLKDKSLAEEKGKQGRKLVEERFREEVRAEKVEKVYASLFEGG